MELSTITSQTEQFNLPSNNQQYHLEKFNFPTEAASLCESEPVKQELTGSC